MGKHEQKRCPRCETFFECKTGDVLKCQCFGIKLSDDEERFISLNYNDCLCSKCLVQLKSQYPISSQ